MFFVCSSSHISQDVTVMVTPQKRVQWRKDCTDSKQPLKKLFHSAFWPYIVLAWVHEAAET